MFLEKSFKFSISFKDFCLQFFYVLWSSQQGRMRLLIIAFLKGLFSIFLNRHQVPSMETIALYSLNKIHASLGRVYFLAIERCPSI